MLVRNAPFDADDSNVSHARDTLISGFMVFNLNLSLILPLKPSRLTFTDIPFESALYMNGGSMAHAAASALSIVHMTHENFKI